MVAYLIETLCNQRQMNNSLMNEGSRTECVNVRNNCQQVCALYRLDKPLGTLDMERLQAHCMLCKSCLIGLKFSNQLLTINIIVNMDILHSFRHILVMV